MSEQLKKEVQQQAQAQQDRAKSLHAKEPSSETVTQPIGAALVTGSESPIPPKATPPDQVNKGFSANPGYQPVSRGYPVGENETWHDLTPAQRQEWFTNHENRWKRNFGASAGSMQANMNWTRG